MSDHDDPDMRLLDLYNSNVNQKRGKKIHSHESCSTVRRSLPFRCDVTYKTHLQLTNLLPISYWHEFLDIVFFYKAVNNLVFIDTEALPATRQSTRSTRSSSSNAITYIPKRSRTVTYQRSFFIRACRTWNVLPAELRTSHISLASFKRSLLQYYNKVLDLYDAYNIRTWRTICPRCNIDSTVPADVQLLAIWTSFWFPFDFLVIYE